MLGSPTDYRFSCCWGEMCPDCFSVLGTTVSVESSKSVADVELVSAVANEVVAVTMRAQAREQVPKDTDAVCARNIRHSAYRGTGLRRWELDLMTGERERARLTRAQKRAEHPTDVPQKNQPIRRNWSPGRSEPCWKWPPLSSGDAQQEDPTLADSTGGCRRE